ncbi:MAG: hypothetical protein ACI4D8_01740, partial [Wujia sp.]
PMGQQPYGQPMGQQPYGQPMGQQPYGQPYGMQKSNPLAGVSKDTWKLISLIGALLIAVAPFMNWLSYKYKGYKSSSNMFQLGYKAAVDGEDKMAIFTVSAIIMLVVGLFLIIYDFAEYNSLLMGIRNSVSSVPVDFIAAAVVVLFGLIVFFNGDLGDVIEDLDHTSHGLGFVALLIGAIARVVNGVFNK